MYEQSHHLDYLALVICIIVCLSWAVNHYRDNAITYKAQRDKNARELKLANAADTDMQMRQRDVAALDAKYTKELADAKAENDALRDDVAAGVVVGCTSKRSFDQCVKPPPPPAWIMQPPPDWQTPLNRIISPSEEAVFLLQKQLEGTLRHVSRLNEIGGALSMERSYNCVSNTRAQRSINA